MVDFMRLDVGMTRTGPMAETVDNLRSWPLRGCSVPLSRVEGAAAAAAWARDARALAGAEKQRFATMGSAPRSGATSRNVDLELAHSRSELGAHCLAVASKGLSSPLKVRAARSAVDLTSRCKQNPVTNVEATRMPSALRSRALGSALRRGEPSPLGRGCPDVHGHCVRRSRSVERCPPHGNRGQLPPTRSFKLTQCVCGGYFVSPFEICACGRRLFSGSRGGGNPVNFAIALPRRSLSNPPCKSSCDNGVLEESGISDAASDSEASDLGAEVSSDERVACPVSSPQYCRNLADYPKEARCPPPNAKRQKKVGFPSAGVTRADVVANPLHFFIMVHRVVKQELEHLRERHGLPQDVGVEPIKNEEELEEFRRRFHLPVPDQEACEDSLWMYLCCHGVFNRALSSYRKFYPVLRKQLESNAKGQHPQQMTSKQQRLKLEAELLETDHRIECLRRRVKHTEVDSLPPAFSGADLAVKLRGDMTRSDHGQASDNDEMFKSSLGNSNVVQMQLRFTKQWLEQFALKRVSAQRRLVAEQETQLISEYDRRHCPLQVLLRLP